VCQVPDVSKDVGTVTGLHQYFYLALPAFTRSSFWKIKLKVRFLYCTALNFTITNCIFRNNEFIENAEKGKEAE
jgi:hypothetical protein